jgi:hypothetical protein
VDNPLGREWRSGKRVGSKVDSGAFGATGWLREAFRDFRLAQRWGICVRKDVIPTGDRLEDFPAMDRHFFGGLHTEANLVPTDLHHNDRDVVVDDDALVLLPRQDKHESSSTLWEQTPLLGWEAAFAALASKKPPIPLGLPAGRGDQSIQTEYL